MCHSLKASKGKSACSLGKYYSRLVKIVPVTLRFSHMYQYLQTRTFGDKGFNTEQQVYPVHKSFQLVKLENIKRKEKHYLKRREVLHWYQLGMAYRKPDILEKPIYQQFLKFWISLSNKICRLIKIGY